MGGVDEVGVVNGVEDVCERSECVRRARLAAAAALLGGELILSLCQQHPHLGHLRGGAELCGGPLTLRLGKLVTHEVELQ